MKTGIYGGRIAAGLDAELPERTQAQAEAWRILLLEVALSRLVDERQYDLSGLD